MSGKRRARRRRAWTLAAAVAALFLAVPLLARPGGGESFSGGGSSGGGSGGGGGGDGGCIFLLLRLWFELVIRYPAVGIPLTIVIIVLWLRHAKKVQVLKATSTWDAGSPSALPTPVPGRSAGRDLEAVRRLDPDFSAVTFSDFAYALFARAHEARSDPRELAALAPYVSAAARGHLAGRPPVGAPVSGVVVGAMRVIQVMLPPAGGAAGGAAQLAVGLELEANLTVGSPGAQRTHYLRERWHLVRDAGVHSKPPAKVRTFQCPNCGAPLGAQNSERCEYCGQATAGGRFDWSVESIVLVHLEERPPAIGSDVAEVGTDYPTIVHPEAGARWAELVQTDPATNDQTLVARLGLIYGELNAAWTAADLPRIRPFVSDSLFGYLRYWIDAYEAQGLRNVLEGMRIERWKIAKVVRDRYFDAVTFRIWGSGRDYLVRKANGERLSGDPRRDRAYSEYWTLIRGAAVRGAPRADKACPNCGAELDVNMAGECAHCGSRVTSGDFDWVLSKIEQDDSYGG